MIIVINAVFINEGIIDPGRIALRGHLAVLNIHVCICCKQKKNLDSFSVVVKSNIVYKKFLFIGTNAAPSQNLSLA